MMDNIRFAHLNASSLVKSEVQHMILRQLGKQIHFLTVVETHTTPQLESSLRMRYPHIVFYFNHGNKQANKEKLQRRQERNNDSSHGRTFQIRGFQDSRKRAASNT